MMLGGLLGNSSVLVIDDDVHRERRRQMLPAFHRDAVARQTTLMAEIAAANIAKWPIDTEFAVAPRMSEITLEVILRTVIGASDPSRLAALRDVMPKLLNVTPWASLAIAKPSLQRLGPWRALRRNMDEADRLLYAEIADRRADPELGSRTDALAKLVRAARRRRRHDDGQGTARPAHHPARRGARHDGDRAVMGARTADTSPRPPAQGGARRRGKRGRRSHWRRVSRCGGEGDAADPACRVRRRPHPEGAGRARGLSTARRHHGRAGNRVGAQQFGAVSETPTDSTRTEWSAARRDRPCGCRSAVATAAALARRSRWSRCGSCCVRCFAESSCAPRQRPQSGRRSNTSS